jgi:hypothetical protein
MCQVTMITPRPSSNGAVEVTKETRIEGPEFCFAGVHTTKALPGSDMRRAFPNAVSIAAGPSLQADIDALPVHVQTLTIRSGSGLYDDRLQGVTLEKYLPELQELQLIDVSFEKIVLSAALTPMLRHLKLQNDYLAAIVIFVETKRKFLHVHARACGGITLWKSVLITVKVEIGGTTAQIELRGVEDKRRLDLVAKAVF